MDCGAGYTELSREAGLRQLGLLRFPVKTEGMNAFHSVMLPERQRPVNSFVAKLANDGITPAGL